MTAPTDSFQQLMDQLRTGDDAAASEVFNRFAQQILALARRRLHDALRAKVDPEDVLQSVFRSFFTRQREGGFAIEDWDSLWGILMVMTVRKCGRRAQYHQAARRDARREVSFDRSLDEDTSPGLLAREPTPSETVMLIDLVGRLMRGLSEEERSVLTLHLQGYTIAEIKARTGHAMRTVRRILERARNHLRTLQDQELSE
jgi:RNA polymerase sigma-70 factor (ECF subfamily)